MQWPLAVAVVVSRESRDEKAELVRNCPSENKDVKIRSLAFYSSEFVRKITDSIRHVFEDTFIVFPFQSLKEI